MSNDPPYKKQFLVAGYSQIDPMYLRIEGQSASRRGMPLKAIRTLFNGKDFTLSLLRGVPPLSIRPFICSVTLLTSRGMTRSRTIVI